MSRAKTFDELYRSNADPWSFQTSPYERAKYSATLDALHRPRYGRVLEVGCSIGVLTDALALRADHILALDISDVALSIARDRSRASNVRYLRADVPGEWPGGTYDLIVLSEILYFLTASEIRRCAALAAQAAAPGGETVLVNWLGPTDTKVSGDDAAEIFLQSAQYAGLAAAPSIRADQYRLDHLTARA